MDDITKLGPNRLHDTQIFVINIIKNLKVAHPVTVAEGVVI